MEQSQEKTEEKTTDKKNIVLQVQNVRQTLRIRLKKGEQDNGKVSE